MKDLINDRMKQYENSYCIRLPRRMPIIVRCDMRAAHTYTRHFDRPFDSFFHSCMVEAAKALCGEISGTKLAYTQSDEISLLITNSDSLVTQPWFDNKLQKIVSVAAAIASVNFHAAVHNLLNIHLSDEIESLPQYKEMYHRYCDKLNSVVFDARAFVIPEDEIVNYFIARQLDASRNSIQMMVHAYFPHKECQNKSSSDLQELIYQEKGINWNNYEPWQKHGSCIRRVAVDKDGIIRHIWQEDTNTPIFTKDRNYIWPEE